MSLKRSHTSSKSSFGGSDAGAKVDRQELFDELKRMAASNEAFTPVDVALSIGAGEPQVSKALLGLAAEGYLEKVETGKYRATGMAELGQAEFLKAFARASRVDSTRQRDLSDIARLKQNNDIMRQRLLAAIAERDHYLAALKKHGIDPGPAPVAPASAPASANAPANAPASANDSAPGPDAMAVPSPASEEAPSGPGDAGGHEGAPPDARGLRPASRHACHADTTRGGGGRRASRRRAVAHPARPRGRAPPRACPRPSRRGVFSHRHEPARPRRPDRRDRRRGGRLPRPDRGDRPAGPRRGSPHACWLFSRRPGGSSTPRPR